MKAIMLGAALALLFVDEKPCDNKKLDEAPWCSKCDAVLEKDGVDKEGKCAECKTKTEKVKVCVKSYYKADCCGTTHEDEGT